MLRMTLRFFTVLGLIGLFTGCDPSLGYTKEEGRLIGGRAPDGADLCASEGWYADGVCDAFCPTLDSDCGSCPSGTDPRVRFVSTDPAFCAAASVGCDSGETLFNDSCGCGCISACPDPANPRVTYIGRGPDIDCALADFGCPASDETFESTCGCGCIAPAAPVCPDPTDPYVRYFSEEPDACATSDWGCAPGETSFDDDACGCGCIEPTASGCQDPADPLVTYWSRERTFCGSIDLGCEPGTSPFDDACGCGCIGE